MNYTPVCCAVIQNGEQILAVRRSEKMSHPLKWEFPGGKIEPDETPQSALAREIKEELSVEINILQPLTSVKHDYKNKAIELIPFLTEISSGNIYLTEHQEYRWLHRNELLQLDWAEADVPVVMELITQS